MRLMMPLMFVFALSNRCAIADPQPQNPALTPESPTASATTATAVGSARPADNLPAIDVHYLVSWGGLGVGKVDVSLKPDVGADCYQYTTISHPTALARSLYGAPSESSQFCVKNGQIRSRHFNSVLPSDARQTYALNFDWDKHTVTDQSGQTRTIPENAVDSFALQQAVRLWVSAHANDANPPLAEFDMVDRKNLTHYQFKLTGHETVETHDGSFDALKMERVDNPKKEGLFWLAAERDYMPVKITTRSGNKPAVTLILSK
jgi:hypothetical protein